jgi:hypothetical protein
LYYILFRVVCQWKNRKDYLFLQKIGADVNASAPISLCHFFGKFFSAEYVEMKMFDALTGIFSAV